MDDGRVPTDLLMEVFVCLPVKSIERFRCVSKSWCCLIKSPAFINSHLLKQQRNGRMLMVKRYVAPQPDEDVLSFHDLNSPELDEVWPNVVIPFLKDLNDKYDYRRSRYHKTVFILGPSNGLIGIFCIDEHILISNPSLREFAKLPKRYTCQKGYSLDDGGVGFGSISIRDFKFILVGRLDNGYISDESRSLILLYNSCTNSWREMDDHPLVNKIVFCHPFIGIFFRGACHWNAQPNNVPTRSEYILTFDLKNEVFSELEYSDSMILRETNFLFILNDCLAFIHNQWGSGPYKIEVWAMKEYGIKESWTRQYVLEPEQLIFRFLCSMNHECMFVVHDPGQLASLDLNLKEYKTFPIYGWEDTLSAHVYYPSLISVKKILEGKPFGKEE